MFRNVRLYRFAGDWPDTETELSMALQKAAFKPCGPLTERSSGFVSPDPDNETLLARRLNGADLLQLRSQSRVLPAAAINEALEERIEEYRSRMQEEPGRRQIRKLKAETRDELLPKALVKSDRIRAFVDIKTKIIGIDTGQESVAERLLRHLRIAFEGLDIRPLQYKQPASDFLTGLFLGDSHERFAVGRECLMQDATDATSKVRWTHFDLSDPSIRSHVADAMHLLQLGIEYDSVLACVLDETGTLRKLKFLGMDDDDDGADNSELARLDAEFVVLTGTLRNVLDDLKKALSGFA